MIYYMNSNTFFDVFLEKEDDHDILQAQYVCVSSHIRKRDTDVTNVVCLSSMLYPGPTVFNKGSFEEMKSEYFAQLEEEAIPFLAHLIYGSIKDNYNIILMCNKKEWKLKYLKWLSEFIFYYFDYPIYDYKRFINGCGIIEYDREKILKKTKKIIKETKNENTKKLEQSKLVRRKLMNQYKSMSKKELKKILIKKELYTEGMSKFEMIDMLEAFL